MDPLTESVYRLHAQILKVLAHPKRLMILDLLHTGPRTVGDIEAALAVPQANVSQHLAALRHEGIVTTRREGNTVWYALASEKVVQACDVFHEFLAERLESNQALASQFAESRPLARAGTTGEG